LGPTGANLVAVAAVLTTATTANAALVVGSRILFAMGRDGALPRSLGRIHPQTGSPWLALIVTAACLAAVAVGGSIALAAAAGGFLYVLHYLVPIAALIRLRRSGGPRPIFVTPAPHVVLPLAVGACVLMLIASGGSGVAGGVGWLVAGLAVYAAPNVATALYRLSASISTPPTASVRSGLGARRTD
jgi:APA family basic amino acid/polyamine antiporter